MSYSLILESYCELPTPFLGELLSPVGRPVSFLCKLTDVQKEGTYAASGRMRFALWLQCERRPDWTEMADLVKV